ncbi:Thiol-disulfide isomerase or thioredoxin [Chitinophaga sp. YR627]|uniref:TlpA family protein disulfide reductase n=1 Tax=Chitinophaga sp. YR627 TaxID=1881041 RepID=UPI0008E0CDA0|nr:TlpA disulfide reductase family protein [Chitinophaga sp. YR627]SFN28933.1 Thiol-disulfide isomerase or thioredoxin [Chitinophaga sp. YR627]
MKFVLQCLSLLTMFGISSVSAQDTETFANTPSDVRPVITGQHVPDFTLYNVLNHEQDQATFKDFKGKAILVDFWAIFCQPCLAQFPKLQRLQEKFADDLQIVTVTYDSLSKVKKLFENIRYQGFKLLTATNGPAGLNDSLYFSFPHKYIPHYVWISRNGTVIASTGHEALNEDNVKALIDGRDLSHLDVNKDSITEVKHPAMFSYQEADIAERMMLNDSITGMLAYSMLSGYNKKYPPSSGIDCLGIYNERRLRIWNLPLSTMLRFAFGELSPDPREQRLVPVPRVFFNIRNKANLERLTVNYTQAPATATDLYCYDLIVPDKGMRMLQERMKEDIYRYFGVKGTIVKKRLACYVLYVSDSSMLKTKGGDLVEEGNIYYLKLRNVPFSKLVEHIRSFNEGGTAASYRGLESAIIIDESHLYAKIDIDLAAKMNDVQALKRALHAFGIELCEDEKNIDVLLLED